VKLVDLDQEETRALRVFDERDFRPHPVRMSRLLLDREAFYVVSAAKMKTHDRVLATLSLKNIVFGAPTKDLGFTWGPRRKPDIEREIGMEYVELPRLLAESDFVSVHSPMRPDTYHQIGARELALMKSTAYLINTARGPVVDEAALVRALKKKQIAGAGLDVFEHEPKVTPALRKMSNVVLTPHLGSAVAEVREQMANIVVDNILALLEGRRPPNIVNPEVLEAASFVPAASQRERTARR